MLRGDPSGLASHLPLSVLFSLHKEVSETTAHFDAPDACRQSLAFAVSRPQSLSGAHDPLLLLQLAVRSNAQARMEGDKDFMSVYSMASQPDPG